MGLFNTIMNALSGKSTNQSTSVHQNVSTQRVDAPAPVTNSGQYRDFSIIANLNGYVYNDPTTGMPVNFFINVSIMFSYDYGRYGDIHHGDVTCKNMEAFAAQVINTYIEKYRIEKGGSFEDLREYLKSPVLTYDLAKTMSDQKRNDGFSMVAINIRDAFLPNEGQV